MTNNLISIIVPVYNTEKYLQKCLESIINQTYSNIEIIIVNDGSTDNSKDIIKSFAKIDKRVLIFDQINQGPSAARNRGLAKAKGDYIIFIDSDDWIDVNLCIKAYDFISKYQADSIMWSYASVFKNKSKSKKLFKSENLYTNINYKLFYKNLIGLSGTKLSNPPNIDSLSSVCFKMYKKSIIAKNNIKFIDTKSIGTEDLLFNIEYFNLAHSVVTIPDTLYFYRKSNNNSITSNYRPYLKNQWSMLYKRIYNIVNNEIEFVEALNNRKVLNILGLGLNILNSNKNLLKSFNDLNEITKSKEIEKAFKHFSFVYLPLHWKIFYFSAKYKLTFLLYIQLKIIKIMIKL